MTKAAKRFWRTVLLLIALAILLVVGRGLLTLSGLAPPLARQWPKIPKEQLTHAWQTEYCISPAQPNLDEISLPKGKIADVEILDLPSGRIYLPRPWTSTSRHFYGPSSDGLSVATGWTGTFTPWRGPGAEDPCRGRAFISAPGERSNGPRFTIGLLYRPSSHEIMELRFLEPGKDDPYGLPLSNLIEDNAVKPLDDGWVIGAQKATQVLRHFAFDTQAAAAGKGAAVAYESYGGWVVIFPIDNLVTAKIEMKREVPVKRWRLYGERATQFYRWLQAKPAERGSSPTTF